LHNTRPISKPLAHHMRISHSFGVGNKQSFIKVATSLIDAVLVADLEDNCELRERSDDVLHPEFFKMEAVETKTQKRFRISVEIEEVTEYAGLAPCTVAYLKQKKQEAESKKRLEQPSCGAKTAEEYRETFAN
jgi:hypothetical protein